MQIMQWKWLINFVCVCVHFLKDLRDLDNDDLNVQLDVFEDHKDDDSVEFQHRWKDISINFEYPF